MLQNLSLRRQLATALLILTTVVITASIVGGIVYMRLDRTNQELTQSIFKTQASSRDMFEAAMDEETGVRGYLLTANAEYLEPYTNGQQRLQVVVPNLSRASPNHVVDAKINASVAALETWNREFAQPALDQKRQGTPLGDQQVAHGKALFDNFRKAYDDLYSALLSRREHLISSQHHQLGDLGVLLAGAVTALLVAAAVLWVMLNRLVVKPVARLLGDVQKVAAGDIEHVVRGEGPADVVELSTGVEAMRKRIVGELREVEVARTELTRSNSDLEQFAYVASHDLQEPLRKVISFCQLLEQRYSPQLDDRGKQYIDFAVTGAKRMQRLINDLLSFSRVGRTASGFQDVDLNSVITEVQDSISEAIEEKRATITCAELPTVFGERSLLSALFQNLIANGIKFQPPGSDPTVDISVRGEGDNWHFVVEDNGIGIDPTYAERIFVIFQRLHGRDEYGGTGIGLALCRKIVEFHSGKIWLDAQPGTGARFHFTLPKRKAE